MGVTSAKLRTPLPNRQAPTNMSLFWKIPVPTHMTSIRSYLAGSTTYRTQLHFRLKTLSASVHHLAGQVPSSAFTTCRGQQIFRAAQSRPVTSCRGKRLNSFSKLQPLHQARFHSDAGFTTAATCGGTALTAQLTLLTNPTYRRPGSLQFTIHGGGLRRVAVWSRLDRPHLGCRSLPRLWRSLGTPGSPRNCERSP